MARSTLILASMVFALTAATVATLVSQSTPEKNYRVVSVCRDDPGPVLAEEVVTDGGERCLKIKESFVPLYADSGYAVRWSSVPGIEARHYPVIITYRNKELPEVESVWCIATGERITAP